MRICTPKSENWIETLSNPGISSNAVNERARAIWLIDSVGWDDRVRIGFRSNPTNQKCERQMGLNSTCNDLLTCFALVSQSSFIHTEHSVWLLPNLFVDWIDSILLRCGCIATHLRWFAVVETVLKLFDVPFAARNFHTNGRLNWTHCRSVKQIKCLARLPANPLKYDLIQWKSVIGCQNCLKTNSRDVYDLHVAQITCEHENMKQMARLDVRVPELDHTGPHNQIVKLAPGMFPVAIWRTASRMHTTNNIHVVPGDRRWMVDCDEECWLSRAFTQPTNMTIILNSSKSDFSRKNIRKLYKLTVFICKTT